jgi:hypothetical protein
MTQNIIARIPGLTFNFKRAHVIASGNRGIAAFLNTLYSVTTSQAHRAEHLPKYLGL